MKAAAAARKAAAASGSAAAAEEEEEEEEESDASSGDSEPPRSQPPLDFTKDAEFRRRLPPITNSPLVISPELLAASDAILAAHAALYAPSPSFCAAGHGCCFATGDERNSRPIIDRACCCRRRCSRCEHAHNESTGGHRNRCACGRAGYPMWQSYGRLSSVAMPHFADAAPPSDDVRDAVIAQLQGEVLRLSGELLERDATIAALQSELIAVRQRG